MAFDAFEGRVEAVATEVRALFLAARDPRTPALAKGLVVLLVAYAVSPIDPIPDFIPVVGHLDELVVLPAGAALAARLVPEPVLADCRARADEDVDVGVVPWLGAGLVVLLWALVAFLAARALW